jgi:hypothetical protein
MQQIFFFTFGTSGSTIAHKQIREPCICILNGNTASGMSNSNSGCAYRLYFQITCILFSKTAGLVVSGGQRAFFILYHHLNSVVPALSVVFQPSPRDEGLLFKKGLVNPLSLTLFSSCSAGANHDHNEGGGVGTMPSNSHPCYL